MKTRSSIEQIKINIFNSKNFILLFLIAAGLAGNYFNYEIFLNINFLFGSIFALLALQFVGGKRGILAGAVIAGYTYILWNHPYAIIIMTAEVVSVFLLMKWYKIGMVFADMLFWCILGLPQIYLFYHILMHVPNSNTYIVMVKQSVNGIANALLARLIFTLLALRLRSLQISYREIICNLLIFFSLSPVLAILAVNSSKDYNRTNKEIHNSLTQDNARLSQYLKSWISNRQLAITDLAEMASSKSAQQMQPFLERTKKADINFLRVGLLNKEAVSTAFFPLIDEIGHLNIGRNFADRPFIPKLRETLKPMLSEVVMGRIGHPMPLVSLLVPIVIHGKYAGYIIGVLKLSQLSDVLKITADENNLLYTLVDKKSHTILTNRPDQKIMAPFVRAKGKLISLDHQIQQWVPPAPPNTPISEQWKKSFYITESFIGDLGEWKLILEQPIAPFQKRLYDQYTGDLILVLFILFMALLLAEILSRMVVTTLTQLGLMTNELPLRLATDDKNMIWPESEILEMDTLINNFKKMAQSLSKEFRKNEQANQSLEKRVEERTVELNRALVETERFRETLNYITPHIYMKDLQCRYTYANKSRLELFGCSPKELIGSDDSRFFPTSTVDQLHKIDSRVFLGESTAKEIEVLDTEGDRRVYWEIKSPIYEEPNSKKICGLLGISTDITERKLLEDELVRAKIAAESANRAKSAFLASMSHELRTPLNGILGFSELLEMEDLSPLHKKYLSYISKSGTNLLSLINDILDLSKVEAEKIELEKAVFNIKSYIEEIVLDHSLKAKEKNIFLDKNFSSDLEKTYVGDRLRLKQVLNNLISNAIKFTKVGGVTVSVDLISKKENSDLVKFLVSDTGIGMNQETLGIIFKPFVQASSGTSREYGGTGLGLAISKKLVELMGSELKVESVLGKGSTFFFEISLLKSVESITPERKIKNYRENPLFENLSVLLVEDNLINLNLETALLHSLKCQVKAVERATDGFVFMEKEKFDLLLIDIQMPGMSGVEMINFIREKERTTKNHQRAIALTAYALSGDKEQYLQEGFDGYVSKPINLDVLAQEMEKVLKQ